MALRRATSAITSLTPGKLFTIGSDFSQKLIELFDHCDGFIKAGKQIVQEALFEFGGFLVFPGMASFPPPKGELLACGGETAS
jgi:hypothetical protein